MLIAFLLYNDGIGTIIRMATGSDRDRLSSGALIAAICSYSSSDSVLVPVRLDRAEDRDQAAVLADAVYTGIAVSATSRAPRRISLPSRSWSPWCREDAGAFALVVRSARATPPFRRVLRLLRRDGKFAGIFGPRCSPPPSPSPAPPHAVLSVIAFFALGALFLLKVNVEAGLREAARPKLPPSQGADLPEKPCDQRHGVVLHTLSQEPE